MGCGASRLGQQFINAAREGNAKVVEDMLEAHPELVHYADPITGLTALHMAAIAPVAKEERFYVRCIEALVRKGAEVDAQIDGAHMTPLFFAIRAQKTKLVHALIAAGADVRKIRDNRGWSALHFAVAESRPKAIETRSGLTPSDSTILRQVLNAKANVDSVTNAGYTALHLACKHEKAHMIQILLQDQHRASPSTPDPNGDTPLHYAVKMVDQPNAVRALLRANAETDKFNNAGYAPIHLAAMYNNPDAIEQLALYGARLDLPDHSGMTPSAIAYQRGHMAALNALDRMLKAANGGQLTSPGSGMLASPGMSAMSPLQMPMSPSQMPMSPSASMLGVNKPSGSDSDGNIALNMASPVMTPKQMGNGLMPPMSSRRTSVQFM